MWGWVSQLCYVYKWTVRQCLDMPVVHFFRMLKESNVIQGAHYAQLTDIQAISVSTTKHYENLFERYRRMMGRVEQHPEFQPIDRALKSDSDEAKYAMMSLFRGMRH